VENCVEPLATTLSMAISRGLGVAVGVGVLCATDAACAPCAASPTMSAPQLEDLRGDHHSFRFDHFRSL